jgi:dipeptidyl aminopeptidase/acylaminoacyl peptidase
MTKQLLKSFIAILIVCLGAAPAHAIDEQRLRVFLEGNDFWNVRLSPDGKHLAAITERDDRNTLIVVDIETLEPSAAVKYEESSDIEISSAEWINNEIVGYRTTRKIAQYESPFLYPDMFLLSVDGKTNKRIWSVAGNYEDNRVGKGDLVRGFPWVISRLEEDDNKLLLYISSFERRDGAGRGGVYTLELDSGDTREHSRLPHLTQSVTSNADGSVLVAVTMNRQSNQEVFLTTDLFEWKPLTMDLDGMASDFTPFRVEGDYVYARTQYGDAIDAPTHIVRYKISTGEWEDVFEIGFASVSSVAIGDDGELDRVQWVDGEPKIAVLDKSDKVSQVVSAFARSYEGFNISVVNQTDDEKLVLLHVGSGAHAGEYFLFDFETRKARFLISMREKIDGNELSPLEDASFVASDGVTIPGWFQAPKGVELPPLVVYIHGGPHGPYNEYSFNTRWHLLNEMGYAVYAPNFRGSGGYGPRFEQSGYGLWGTRMIDDMYEGVQALIDAGKVNPDRVCAFGGSYGGYGTAQSLVRHNDFYKCGVIIAGVFDFKVMMKLTDIADTYMGDNFMAKVIGEDPELLRSISPQENIDKIKAPMLILHGEEDERTPFKDAVKFVEALKEQDKRFEYKWYPKEGHGNVNIDNRVDEWQRIQAFFHENL